MTLVKNRGETEKILAFSDKNEINNERSQITEFFNDCNVLITGGSGFVGKLLIEKILRSCPNVSKIFILLRAKKGKSPEERFKEQFEDSLYDRVKFEQPDYMKKVQLIDGGLDDKGLVLAPEDREILKTSHVVFHGAATVRFDDSLRFATNINVRGTKEMLILAREMPNLKAFVHIGTAFSMCVTKFIDEVFYKGPIEADKLLTLVDTLDDANLEYLTPKLLGKWPNTYAFTKTIGEDMVLKYSKDLPVCIVRPAIMISTAKEPVPGWINNLYGATGVAVGIWIGVIRTLHSKVDLVADMIPADYVINNIVAAAWDIGTQSSKNSPRALPSSQIKESNDEQEKKDDPPIYNSVSSCQNPITWGKYFKFSHDYAMQIPSMSAVWYLFFTPNKHYWVHMIYIYLFHLLPAVIADSFLRIIGQKPKFLKTYKKVHKFMDVISYFATQQWKFRNDNVMKLWNKLSPIDKKLYYFNVGEVVWSEFASDYMKGIRECLLKDPLSTLPMAQKRYFRLKIVHYTLATLASLGLLWLAYFLLATFVSFLISFCPYFNN